MNETEDTFDNVVLDGIRFMESLSKHYGQEKGMEIWEAFGPIMGREVQGKILFKMLTGSYSGRISFRQGTARDMGNTVACIKAIRSYTGIGLKDAKDLFDESSSRIVSIDLGNVDEQREVMREFRTLGLIVQ